MMKNYLRVIGVGILAILLPIFLIACGGGGGGGGGGAGGGGDTQVNPLTSNIRTYKIGDSVTYQMTLKDTTTGEEASGDVTSRITGEVTNPYGIKCKIDEFSGTLTGQSGSFPFREKVLFFQDASGNLYDCGKYDEATGAYIFIFDTQDTPNGLKFSFKNPVSIGNTFSGRVNYTDWSWIDCTVSIVGTEVVTTLMGKYDTYKVSENCSSSDGFTIVGTDWLYPSISTVKSTSVMNRYEITLNMKNYNLAQ